MALDADGRQPSRKVTNLMDDAINNPPLHAVTGAFGYSGRYIAQRLLNAGIAVRTLTSSPRRVNPFGNSVEIREFDWRDTDRLAAALDGVEVLYNTYWVRFNSKNFCFAEAVENSRKLFAAARAAGVRRIVHVSITNPDIHSNLEYFRGKAQVEQALTDCGVAFTILRPAVLFGKEDILINNIAWMLRRLPVFGVFGDGEYKMQPIYVDDLAELAVRSAGGSTNEVIQAIGPETFTYRELVKAIGRIIGCDRPIISVNPEVGYLFAAVAGKMVHDVIITLDEIRGLMEGRLFVDGPAAGTTRLTQWSQENRQWLGHRYASEMARRRDRVSDYTALRGDGQMVGK